MNLGLLTIVSNLGFSLSSIIYLVVIIGCIIFFANDFKIGLIVNSVIMALLFMWFYYMNWDYKKPLITFFIIVVLLSLSIFLIDRRSRIGLL